LRGPRIEFVRPRFPIALWVGFAFLFAVVAGGTVVRHQQLNAARHDKVEATRTLLIRIAGAKVPAPQPRALSLEQTASALRVDLNKVFSTAENAQEPGSQLKSIAFDESGRLRFEYTIDSVPRSSSITAALNAGYESPVWTLEGIMESSTTQSFGAQSYRAAWRAAYSKL
jgi:hypothetical protein